MKGFSRIFQLKGLKSKDKGQANFYECCDLTKKVYLVEVASSQLMQYGIFIRVEHSVYSKRWGKLLSEDYLSCREVSPAAAAVVLQKRLGFSIWYVVSIHFSWREDMKHETRMARLGVCTFHVEYTSHPFRWLHTHCIMSTLEKAFWQYRTLVYNLPSTTYISIYSSRYSAHHMMRQSSAKFTKKMFKS